MAWYENWKQPAGALAHEDDVERARTRARSRAPVAGAAADPAAEAAVAAATDDAPPGTPARESPFLLLMHPELAQDVLARMRAMNLPGRRHSWSAGTVVGRDAGIAHKPESDEESDDE